jgi:hypothetical protein
VFTTSFSTAVSIVHVGLNLFANNIPIFYTPFRDFPDNPRPPQVAKIKKYPSGQIEEETPSKSPRNTVWTSIMLLPNDAFWQNLEHSCEIMCKVFANIRE